MLQSPPPKISLRTCRSSLPSIVPKSSSIGSKSCGLVHLSIGHYAIIRQKALC